MQNFSLTVLQAIIGTAALAIVLSIPAIWYNNKKFGKLSFKRALLYLLFLFYLCFLFIYSLTPSAGAGAAINLHPFNFVKDIFPQSFTLQDPTKTVNSPAFYQMASTLFIYVPFGLFLKKIFNLTIYKILVLAALFAVFIEILHGTGNFGFTARYRSADIDNVLMATFGSTLGWICAPLLKFLPTSQELTPDEQALPQRVSLSRRISQLFVDALTYFGLSFLISLIYSLISGISPGALNDKQFSKASAIEFATSALLSVILLFIVIPLFNHGRSFGDTVTKLQAVSPDGAQAAPWQIVVKALTGFGLYAICTSINRYYSLSSLGANLLILITLLAILYNVNGLSCLAARLVLRDERDLTGKHQHYIKD